MNHEDPLVRSLRAGPPDEDEYVAVDLGLSAERSDDRIVPVTTFGYRRLVSVRPNVQWRSPEAGFADSRRRPGWVPQAAMLLVAVVLAAASFVAGRATGPVASTSSSEPSLLAPASVPGQLQRAFAEVNAGPEPVQWVVCTADAAFRCSSAPSHQLPTAIWATNVAPGKSARGFAVPSTFWNELPVVSVVGPRIMAALDLHPQSFIDGRLFAVDAWTGHPFTLSGVSADPGTWFFDLGTLAPGRYVLATEIDTPAGLEVSAVGIRVG